MTHARAALVVLGIRKLIISFCPISPSRRFNGIAVVNRDLNVVWRRQCFVHIQKMIRLVTRLSLQRDCTRCHQRRVALTLLDIQDVIDPQAP